MKKPVKMVLCDLDGTLLYDTKTVTDRTKKALKKLREQGILIGICSGRSAVALKKMIRYWGIEHDVDFVLGFNGAMFWNPVTGEEETDFYLQPEEIREIQKAIEGYSFAQAEYQGQTMLSTKDNPVTRQMARRNQLGFRVVSPEELLQPAMKFMAVGMPWTVNRWLHSEAKKDLKGCRVFRSGPFLLEFVHPGLSKLEGAKKAAHKYGIALDEIVSFGNDNNDLEMLAGTIGVAMDNALPEVKKAAAYQTGSNKKDGVAQFIEENLLD